METSIPEQIPPSPAPHQFHLKPNSPHHQPKNPHPSATPQCKQCNPQPSIHLQNPAFHFPSIPQPGFLKLTPSANPSPATISHRFPLFPPQRLLRLLLSILSCLVNPHRRASSSPPLGCHSRRNPLLFPPKAMTHLLYLQIPQFRPLFHHPSRKAFTTINPGRIPYPASFPLV